MAEKKKVLVAMSGGVDSSVACALLKEDGYEVGGATMRMGIPEGCAVRDEKACCGAAGVKDAHEVAGTLGIPHWFFNFDKEFRQYVIDYFAEEYLKGRTPNPCIACNEHIKFRLFFARARELGYDFIATGHYARLGHDAPKARYFVREGADPSKDQSYVLFPLGQEILSRLVLPAGEFTKTEIRARARALNLCVMDKPDSQEICFVPNDDYGLFLEREYLKNGAAEKILGGKTGVIRTRDGRVLGSHKGYFHYTRGQRRGLGVAFKERLYVIETIPQTNEVVVGTKEEILDTLCRVRPVNWFLKPEASGPFRTFVKIRSQHRKAPATVTFLDDESVSVVFDEPQEAVTPGQGAVFYDGDKVLGGGWIDSAGGEIPARTSSETGLQSEIRM